MPNAETPLDTRGPRGLKRFSAQIASVGTAGFAAACCLGAPLALGALSAIGVSFLIRDAFLIPFLVAALGLSLWLLWRQGRIHGRRGPLLLASAGAIAAVAGLYVHSAVVIAGVIVLFGASLWDYRLTRTCPAPLGLAGDAE